MRTTKPRSSVDVCVLALLVGCGGGGGTADGGDGSAGAMPVVQVIDPQNRTTIVSPDGNVNVLVASANFTIEEPALCGTGNSGCGQVQVTVDGGRCSAVSASPSVSFDLTTCEGGPISNGSSHTFTATLIDGAGAAIPGATSTSTVTINTM